MRIHFECPRSVHIYIVLGSLPVIISCRQLAFIKDIQIALNTQGAVIKVLPHLARPSDRLAKEVLAFVSIMLFNANHEVQVSNDKTDMHVVLFHGNGVGCVVDSSILHYFMKSNTLITLVISMCLCTMVKAYYQTHG